MAYVIYETTSGVWITESIYGDEPTRFTDRLDKAKRFTAKKATLDHIQRYLPHFEKTCRIEEVVDLS